jgi:hypothetical protein
MFGSNGGQNITNISHLFGECENMTGSIQINDFLDKLPNLVYAVAPFYKCGT